ncbi:putative prefoldin subunit 5-like [Dorcoceras hygrometricum]|uniref:Putative prefoldin subunit 5-like n=1 Tax=Dorcoceras hygrometricum TaxID=472368 RepID=A0A2Z7CBP7_9LAMI|nr:putative prefoldin subunit 5-like [Dorcoceras hygrometricum]
MAAAAATTRMEIDKMSVEQLRGLKEQVDLEVNLLQDSLNNIRSATTRLELASTALNDLSLRPKGNKTMAQGKDYCERKIALLKSNYDQLLEVAAKKKSIADEAGAVLQAKLKLSAPAQ